MKSALLLITVTVAAAFALSAPTPADPTDDARQTIQAIYDQQDAALSRFDFEGSMAGFAPDFVDISHKGVSVKREQFGLALAELLSLSRAIQSRTVIQALQFQDGGAVVTVKQHGVLTAVDEKVDRLDHITYDEVGRDFWLKTDDGWQEKRSRTVSDTRRVTAQALPVVPARVRTAVSEEIQGACDEADAAIVRGDTEGAMVLFDNPAVKASEKAALDQYQATLSDITSTTTLKRVTVTTSKADAAIVLVKRHLVATQTDPKTGQVGAFEANEVLRSYWNKGKSGWHVAGARLISRNLFIGGIPVDVGGFTKKG